MTGRQGHVAMRAMDEDNCNDLQVKDIGCRTLLQKSLSKRDNVIVINTIVFDLKENLGKLKVIID